MINCLQEKHIYYIGRKLFLQNCLAMPIFLFTFAPNTGSVVSLHYRFLRVFHFVPPSDGRFFHTPCTPPQARWKVCPNHPHPLFLTFGVWNSCFHMVILKIIIFQEGWSFLFVLVGVPEINWGKFFCVFLQKLLLFRINQIFI